MKINNNSIKLTHTEIERIAGITNNFRNIKGFEISTTFDQQKHNCKWLLFYTSEILLNVYEIQD